MKGPGVAGTEEHNDDEDNDEKLATVQTPAATVPGIQRLGEGKNQKNKLHHNLIVTDSDTDSSPGSGP